LDDEKIPPSAPSLPKERHDSFLRVPKKQTPSRGGSSNKEIILVYTVGVTGNRSGLMRPNNTIQLSMGGGVTLSKGRETSRIANLHEKEKKKDTNKRGEGKRLVGIQIYIRQGGKTSQCEERKTTHKDKGTLVKKIHGVRRGKGGSGQRRGGKMNAAPGRKKKIQILLLWEKKREGGPSASRKKKVHPDPQTKEQGVSGLREETLRGRPTKGENHSKLLERSTRCRKV